MSKLTDVQELLEDALAAGSLRGFLAFVAPIQTRLHELGSDERQRLRVKIEVMMDRPVIGLTPNELEVFRTLKAWAEQPEVKEVKKTVALPEESAWMKRWIGR